MDDKSEIRISKTVTANTNVLILCTAAVLMTTGDGCWSLLKPSKGCLEAVKRGTRNSGIKDRMIHPVY